MPPIEHPFIMTSRSVFLRASLIGLVGLSFSSWVSAQQYSAEQLIAGVKAAAPEGGLYVRLRMEHRASPDAGASVLQVQLKRRTTAAGVGEQLYQVQFPKERKGEGLLLKLPKSGGFTGFQFSPGQGAKALQPSDRSLAVFGTAFTIDDLLADFLDWPRAQIVGNEKVGNVDCTIVESQPAKGGRKVRSWIDPKRLVALKIEQYRDGSQPVKIVQTNKVIRADSGRYVPATFTVSIPGGAVTQIEGVRSGSGLTYSDGDFSTSALETVTGPPK